MRLIVAAAAALAVSWAVPAHAHGGGLNACGCHINHKTGECHCHQDRGCGCKCQPDRCPSVKADPTADAAQPLPIVLCGEDTKVPGYTKKDGTYVPEHHRTKANETKNDNYSTKGNVNPYTGEKGTKNPDGTGSKKNPYKL